MSFQLVDNGYNVAPKILVSVQASDKFQNLVSKVEELLGLTQDKGKIMRIEDISVKHSFTTLNVTMDDIATQVSNEICS